MSRWLHDSLTGGIPRRSLDMAHHKLRQTRHALSRRRVSSKSSPCETGTTIVAVAEDLSKCVDRVHGDAALPVLRHKGMSKHILRVMYGTCAATSAGRRRCSGRSTRMSSPLRACPASCRVRLRYWPLTPSWTSGRADRGKSATQRCGGTSAWTTGPPSLGGRTGCASWPTRDGNDRDKAWGFVPNMDEVRRCGELRRRRASLARSLRGHEGHIWSHDRDARGADRPAERRETTLDPERAERDPRLELIQWATVRLPTSGGAGGWRGHMGALPKITLGPQVVRVHPRCCGGRGAHKVLETIAGGSSMATAWRRVHDDGHKRRMLDVAALSRRGTALCRRSISRGKHLLNIGAATCYTTTSAAGTTRMAVLP